MNDSLGALLAIVVLWSILRFAFGGGPHYSTGGNQAPAINAARSRPVPQHMVDSIKALFPHIPDASIRYDLQRSGSVEETCERILNEGGLPSPPAGFFSTAETSTSPNAANLGAQNVHRAPTNAAAVRSSSATSASDKSPNLISRFGLQSRLTSDNQPSMLDSHPSSSNQGSSSSWATTPEERARILKDRKEKMILEARRKMLERQKANLASETTTPAAST